MIPLGVIGYTRFNQILKLPTSVKNNLYLRMLQANIFCK